MKKLICIGLAALFALCAAGCNNKDAAVTNSRPASSAPASDPAVSRENPLASTYEKDEEFDFEQLTTENKELTAKGCPPLSEDLQKLYAGAWEMAESFAMCNFAGAQPSLTADIGGMNYLVIVDERFPTYPEFVDYLKSLFTDEYIYANLLTANSPVKPNDNNLPCVLDAGAGSDITYAGHVFTVDSYTANKISLTATVYYAADYYDGQLFYTTPGNPEDYTAKLFTFELINTENGWRFSQFPFFK